MPSQTSVKTTIGALLIACVSFAGCASEQVNVSEVLNHHQCNKLRTGLNQIKEADLAKIRGVRLLTPPNQVKPTPAQADTTNKSLLLAVSNGSQPTSGYGLVLTSAKAQGQEVRLDYIWQAPPSDAVVAQVITAPCSVVQIDNTSRVSAVSAWLNGVELDRINLKLQ